MAGNAGASGPFAPLVGVVRNAMGVKEFNQLRGKMISLHSQGAPPAEGRAPATVRTELRRPRYAGLGT